jgi:hypothetical protein
MRALQKWAANVNRDLKSQIEWHVRADDLGQLDESNVLRVYAIDPKTDAVLGDTFDLALTEAQIARLRRALQRHPHDVFVLRGVLTPQVRINELRPTEGPFNNPIFIGPFAEFAYEVQPTSLNPDVVTAGDEVGAKAGDKAPPDTAADTVTADGK